MIRLPPRSTLFPSRRSSDLALLDPVDRLVDVLGGHRPLVQRAHEAGANLLAIVGDAITARDRKSTRLNSSHITISYAVFCLKKKKLKKKRIHKLAIQYST